MGQRQWLGAQWVGLFLGVHATQSRQARPAPNDVAAHGMRAAVLMGGEGGEWEAGPRSAVELKVAAAHYERTAALCVAPAQKALLARNAGRCRSLAEAI